MMKRAGFLFLGVALCGLSTSGLSQNAPKSAPAATPQAAPLQLQTLGQTTQADPFPAVDKANFTADSPSVAAVDSYLHAMLGYDATRIWRVEGIQKTASAGVSKVTALISTRGANAKVLNATFYVLPDGTHLVADRTGVTAFGANPFAENRALLKARADGPARGAATSDLLLVEFADLQCPHCKDAQAIVDNLLRDFPKARVVYQSFPLAEIHPFATKAAAYGVCMTKTSNDAFFQYTQAVYDTQAGLTKEAGDQTLAAAVTKAGGDPKAVAACAATDATKVKVDASFALGREAGVNETPELAVNGRLVPLTSIPYETLRQIVAFQATLDGVQGATAPSLKER